MFDRKEEKTKDLIIWQTIDFEKVKQRLNEITQKVEAVQYKFEPQSCDISGRERNKESSL